MCEDIKEVKLVYGNKHELVSDPKSTSAGSNKHKWTIFVKCADKKDGDAVRYIKKVRYGLHETFGSEYIEIMGSNDNNKF